MAYSQLVSEELLDYYTKTASNIIIYYEGDERKSKLEELRELVKQNCIQEQKLVKAEDTTNTVLRSHQPNDSDTSIKTIIEKYKEAIKNIETISEKFAAERLKEYDQRVKALLHNNEENDNDISDEDDEVKVKGGYVNTIDPISKKTIVNAVKNNLCGHTYDRDTITELLKINKKTRCPIIGCKSNQFVTLANLKADIVTQAYLEKQAT